MSALILISGAGQLGSRYLQGLAKCSNTLKILVHDSKIPKQLISEFEVDIAIILHLFCFAKNYQMPT